MTELPPEAAALLESVRRAHGPTERDRQRVLAGLHASLGMAPVIPLRGSESAAARGASHATQDAVHGQGASALFTWKTGKLILAAIALGGAIGWGQLSEPTQHAQPSRAREPAPRTVLTLAPTEVEARAAKTRARRSDTPRKVSGARDLEPESGSAPSSEPAVATAAAAAAPEASPPVALAPKASDHGASSGAQYAGRGWRVHGLGFETHNVRAREQAGGANEAPARASAPREIALIRGALTSLRDRQPGRALALLDEHARVYPSGAVSDERRGLRVIALCAAGRVEEGKREREAFLERAGSSPIAARVRRACDEDGR